MDMFGIPMDKFLLSSACGYVLWLYFALTHPKKRKKDTKKYSVVVDEKERIRRAPESPDKVGISTSLTATSGVISSPFFAHEGECTYTESFGLA